MKRPLFAAAGAAALSVSLLLFTQDERSEGLSAPRATSHSVAATAGGVVAAVAASGMTDDAKTADEPKPAWTRSLAPNERLRVELPKDLRHGIPMPDGSFLPLLNGVPHAEPASRNTSASGPLPPVVAKFADREGSEWWEHADGSTTTTRWVEVTHADGRVAQMVVTDHLSPIPDELAHRELPVARTKSATR